MDNFEARGRMITPEDKTPAFIMGFLPHEFCKNYVKGKRILDVGCGEGYGSDYMAQFAKEVVAVDPEQDAILHAKKRYKRKNLSFHVMDGTKLIFEDNGFDVVLSIQAIEHIEDYDAHIAEAHRVLKKEGIFIVTAWDKEEIISSMILRGELKKAEDYGKPFDPYHFKEFCENELRNALKKRFRKVEMYHTYGSKRYLDSRKADALCKRKMRKADVLGIRRLIPKGLKTKLARGMVNKIVPKAFPLTGITKKDFHVSKQRKPHSFMLIGLTRKGW